MNTLQTILKPINEATQALSCELSCEYDASNLPALRAEVKRWEDYSWSAYWQLDRGEGPEGLEFEGLTADKHIENWRKCARLIELIDAVPAQIKTVTKNLLTQTK
jgi:hypothetical protein